MEKNFITDNNRRILGDIYNEVWPVLFKIFRQVGISVEESEDMVQNVFMKLMKIDVLSEQQIKGLAVKTAYFMRIDYLRHIRFIRESQKSNHDYFLEQTIAHQHLEVEDIENAEMSVVENMSELDAKVYRLSRFEEKDTNEICQILNLSVRAVEGRLYRTRKIVRSQVKEVAL